MITNDDVQKVLAELNQAAKDGRLEVNTNNEGWREYVHDAFTSNDYRIKPVPKKPGPKEIWVVEDDLQDDKSVRAYQVKQVTRSKMVLFREVLK